MATKALNYTAAEINQGLNLAGTAVQPNALNDYYTKTEVDGIIGDLPISEETTQSEDEEIVIGNDAGTDTYAKVGPYGVKAKAYKKLNGDDAIPPIDTTIGDSPSQTNIPTSKAVADYVSAHGGVSEIDSETVTGAIEEESIFGSDDESEEYVAIGNYGIRAKAYYNIDGSPMSKQKANEFEVKTAASLSNGSLKLSEVSSIKKNRLLTFHAYVSSFNQLEIGFYHYMTKYDGIKITDTNVIVFDANNANVETVSHGLTISNVIAIKIVMNIDETADITIMANGNTFSKNISWFRMTNTTAGYAEADVNTSLTDVRLSQSCFDYGKKLWIYGDSYLNYAPERWTYYAEQDHYLDNVLIDGNPGENSQYALTCFKNDIKHGTPDYAVWLLGMNDPDETGGNTATEPNANWLSAITEFLGVCKINGIVPILATIPTVCGGTTPSGDSSVPAGMRYHKPKNDWVKSSGKRYIDLSSAVGANDTTGYWFNNSLANDMLENLNGVRVHPTVYGAKALYYQILSQLNEITIK